MRHCDIFLSVSTPQEPPIGTTEAAQILGKSPRTVHRLVETGVLVPVFVAPGGYAGAFLFARADVEALAAERSEKATA